MGSTQSIESTNGKNANKQFINVFGPGVHWWDLPNELKGKRDKQDVVLVEDFP